MFQILCLLFGVFCCATSALMIKASHLHPAVLSSQRLLIAAVLLSPLYFAQLKKHRSDYGPQHLRLVILPAAVLALHFITWAQGAKATHAANASLIVNMVPVAMPLLLFVTAREVLTAREIAGTLVAVCGAVLLTASDFSISRESFAGDVICFGSMLLFAYYLVLGRVSRGFPSIWLYLIPMYALAGVFCLAVAAFIAEPFKIPPARDALLSLGLALIPTILGHSSLNNAMKHLRGQVVSVVNLFQFLFAGILGFVIFREEPHLVFYGAGALVVCGALIVILSKSTPKPAPTPESLDYDDTAA